MPLYFVYPSIFWVDASDTTLWCSCLAGAMISAQMLCFGSRVVDSRIALVALYILLLSLCSVGGDFFSFPWDYLLLEATFLAAVLLQPLRKQECALVIRPGARLGVVREPTQIAMFALKWLVFRFNISMGVEKIPWVNENEHWTNMTYLTRFMKQNNQCQQALAVRPFPAIVVSYCIMLSDMGSGDTCARRCSIGWPPVSPYCCTVDVFSSSTHCSDRKLLHPELAQHRTVHSPNG